MSTVQHRAPSVGDTVLLTDTRYKVTSTHQTDDGVVVAVRDGRGPARFVLSHELSWDETGFWAPETEGELREAWGK